MASPLAEADKVAPWPLRVLASADGANVGTDEHASVFFHIPLFLRGSIYSTMHHCTRLTKIFATAPAQPLALKYFQ